MTRFFILPILTAAFFSIAHAGDLAPVTPPTPSQAPSVSSSQPPSLKSATALTTAITATTPSKKGPRFSGDLKEGFHFNDKAPNEITADGDSIKPSIIESRHIEFKLPKKSPQSAEAALYVCDDAITFCETHHISIQGTQDQATTEKGPRKGSSRMDEAGFIQGDFKKALSLAQKNHQIVLMDFSARWCPGCVRYEKEIFPTEEFKSLTKNVVKLKVDVDQFDNFAVAEKYNIKGIPTLVVVNSDENEIDRLVDFQFMSKLKPFITTIQADPTPLQELLARNSNDPALQLKLGQRLLASGRTAESIPYLQKVTPPPPELLFAKVTAAEEAVQKDPQQKDHFNNELREAIKAEPGSTRSLGWRTDLLRSLDPKSPESQALVTDGKKLADDLLKDPEQLKKAEETDFVGEFMGYEKLLVAIYKADLIEAAHASDNEILKAWQDAASIGESYQIPASRSGPALRYLIVLSAARKWSEAEAQADRIMKSDPKNIDVQRRKLKILLALKKYDEATRLGEKIIDKAEGRNQFWVAQLLAEAYMGKEKKDSAKRLLTAYLARPEIKDSKMASSKKGMEDLLKKIH
jgi:thiol-disulfide isomerase/thioredoxin